MPRNNEAELKRTLQILPVPAFVFDGAAHKFISVNQLFCDLLGYTEEELKNLPWPSVLADDAEMRNAQQAIDTPQFNVPITFRGRHKNGSIVTSAIKYRDMKFVRDDGEVIAAFFAVVTSSEREAGT
ncbi:MAG: fold [Acidobacteriales bacterium]|nr:fold [Terriglobales bacterium]